MTGIPILQNSKPSDLPNMMISQLKSQRLPVDGSRPEPGDLPPGRTTMVTRSSSLSRLCGSNEARSDATCRVHRGAPEQCGSAEVWRRCLRCGEGRLRWMMRDGRGKLT